MMTANQDLHRQPTAWRAVRRAAAAVRHIHREQALMWDLWWQAGRASAPSNGLLRWVPTLDGHRLAGSHLPAADPAGTGDAA
jgi:hypothetical protein